MTWPSLSITPIRIFADSPLGMGMEMVANAQRMSTFGSAAYPAANTAIFLPFFIGTPVTAVQLFSYNGATVSGNIDVGLYTAGGTRLVSSGSTVHSGTSTLQAFDITDTSFGPGNYYLAVAMDNVTGTLFRIITGGAYFFGVLGVMQQASAFPLPAIATFATLTQNYLPQIGLSSRTVL